jgi:hypothetical protein
LTPNINLTCPSNASTLEAAMAQVRQASELTLSEVEDQGYIHTRRVPPDIQLAREAITWVNWGIAPEAFSVQT